MSDFNISLQIDTLLDTDSYAIITNQKPVIITNVGDYFNFVSASINHSIIDLSVASTITLQITSKVSDALSRLRLGTVQSGDYNIEQTIIQFLNNLSGRPIRLYVTQNINNQPQSTRQVFNGYITSPASSVDAFNGTEFSLQCQMLVGQLTDMTANGSWNDSVKKYDNVFTSIAANQINFDTLIQQLFSNSLLEDSELVEYGDIDIPDTVWAYIPPFINRLDVFKTILIPYSKIIFQRESGEIAVSPLFINDYADNLFNVDVFANDGNYVNYQSKNNAAKIPNRVDVIFGTGLPTPGFGLDINNDIFCSAPYVPQSTNKITSSNANQLQYTDIYATSTSLYNSGKFIMPVEKTLSVDQSLVTNPELLNPLTGSYDSNSFTQSIVYSSSQPQYNTIPQLFSQIYLAELNTQNYNATVKYDYKIVFAGGDPLAKIVTLTNMPNIDYNQMLVVQTTLSLSSAGSYYELSFAPLLSLTGVWRIKS